MSTKNSRYRSDMTPWPELAGKGKTLKLEKLELRLFYFEAGEHNHENLLMIHGLGDEADTWRHVFFPLSEKFHVIALDLPGFGRSDKQDFDYTPDFLLNAIVGLMDKLSISSAILMGSSLGGILAHQIALIHPTRVEGLVLVGGSVLQPEPMGDWSLQLMRMPIIGEWLYTRLRKDPDTAYETLKNVYYSLEELPEPDREFLFYRVNQRVWDDGQRRAYLSTLRKLAPWVKQIQANLPDQLKTVEVPTLVVRGEHDSLFPEANAEAIITSQPNATKVTIQATGHLPQQEDPDGFLLNVNFWLNKNFTPKSIN
jgi:pimeloyl-ACP methyl ester carboxylesterase